MNRMKDQANIGGTKSLPGQTRIDCCECSAGILRKKWGDAAGALTPGSLNLVVYLRMNIVTLRLSPPGIVNHVCLSTQENSNKNLRFPVNFKSNRGLLDEQFTG